MPYKISAMVLAAGQSSRFNDGKEGGRNKLLEPVAGKPMLRHAVEAALASAADPVIVVTGNESAEIRAVLCDLPVIFCDNPDFSNGFSSSLKCGLNTVPEDCDGTLILLGDMPGVNARLLDRMIAGFDPAGDRAIVVATHSGQRGNPVLWARRFFGEMRNLAGDKGARSLFGHYPGLICEVEADNDAPLTDIDTQEALQAYQEQRPQAAQAKK